MPCVASLGLLREVGIALGGVLGVALLLLPLYTLRRALSELRREFQRERPADPPINTIRAIMNAAARNDRRYAEEMQARRVPCEQIQVGDVVRAAGPDAARLKVTHVERDGDVVRLSSGTGAVLSMLVGTRVERVG